MQHLIMQESGYRMNSHIKMKMMHKKKEKKYAQINSLIHDDADNETCQHILLTITKLKKKTYNIFTNDQ